MGLRMRRGGNSVNDVVHKEVVATSISEGSPWSWLLSRIICRVINLYRRITISLFWSLPDSPKPEQIYVHQSTLILAGRKLLRGAQ